MAVLGSVLLWLTCAYGVEMPAGERIVAAAWRNPELMVLLVEEGDSYALRRLELGNGDISVIKAPRSFTKLSAGDDGEYQLQLALDPTGSALALLEKFGTPLNPPELSLFTIADNELKPVDVSRIPQDFYPELMAWNENGTKLYLSSRQYLFPDQPYSIGVFDTDGARFSGIALKANVDLIDSMEFVPKINSLIVSCRGFHGDYPANAMIAIINSNGVAKVLHSKADSNTFHVLANGGALIHVGQLEDNPADSELWLLEPAAEELRSVDIAYDGPESKMQTNGDGTWMGILVSSAELDLPDAGVGRYLILQRIADGKTVLTSEPCADFAFSPSGGQVCTVSAAGTSIDFYNLPE